MADRTVQSDEARRKLRELLNDVEHDGAHVTILRYGVPAAILVPAEWYETVNAEIARARPSAARKADMDARSEDDQQ